jgi:hypothetical protein
MKGSDFASGMRKIVGILISILFFFQPPESRVELSSITHEDQFIGMVRRRLAKFNYNFRKLFAEVEDF